MTFQGVGHRLRGSANAVRIRAPQIGGEFLLLYNHKLFILHWILTLLQFTIQDDPTWFA